MIIQRETNNLYPWSWWNSCCCSYYSYFKLHGILVIIIIIYMYGTETKEKIMYISLYLILLQQAKMCVTNYFLIKLISLHIKNINIKFIRRKQMNWFFISMISWIVLFLEIYNIHIHIQVIRSKQMNWSFLSMISLIVLFLEIYNIHIQFIYNLLIVLFLEKYIKNIHI